ncbi:alpha-L-rhamnosidase [Opitutaceae bacterium EW11]|nr:alpha-L-rhamnosidase [Opitutaceae bacterium EW11]
MNTAGPLAAPGSFLRSFVKGPRAVARCLTAALALGLATGARGELRVTNLRCDWANAPLGIDSAPPHLAWSLESLDRGAHQTAWQVQVASSPDLLRSDKPDRWDSGRVQSRAQFQIPYAGKTLGTGEQVFWRIRVWNENGTASGWSEPSNWTMGIVRPEDWRARWISDPTLLEKTRTKLGFSTPPVSKADSPQWIALDLGASYAVDKVVLHALVYGVAERLGFPRWFRIEVADDPDFRGATTILDHTQNPANEWATKLTAPASGVTARYVRITATRLRTMSEDGGAEQFGRLALRQIEVVAAGTNVARGARVTSSASLEGGPWSSAAVVDGLGVPGSNPRACSTLLLRREFRVGEGLKRATLFVCGLGHYTLEANGSAVGAEDLLTPGWTDYERTCLYDTRDLTAQLKPGANAIALTLANGMYNVPNWPGRYTKFSGPPRPLTAIAQLRLEYTDGRVDWVATDEQWKAAPGPITFSHVYGGEDYDAAKGPKGWSLAGFDDSRWTPVVCIPGPGGELKGASEAAPPIRAHETLTPRAVRPLRAGVAVYDLGQNAALMPRLRVRGPAGSSVKITPSELVNADGSLDTTSTHAGKAESTWNYRLAGGGEIECWMPRFFHHGARYLQVQAFPAAGSSELPVVVGLEGIVVHGDSPAVGRFSCSNELFNRIRLLVRWAQRSNLSHVLTDCPHRERLGWLEQYHLNGPSLRYEYDLTRLYAKTLGDMADSQRPNGLVPSIAPEYIRFDGDFRDSPEWGSALILAAWQQYVWTGDDTPLRRHYASMQRYFAYLESRANRHLLTHGLGDWYDLGPKRPGFSQLTPVSLPATAIFYEDALRLEQTAQHLGEDRDAQRYATAAGRIAEAFNAEFFKARNAGYATGSQTANAFPLVLGLVPPASRDAVLASLVRDIESRGNSVTAGDIGYSYLLKALAENGRSDVVFAMNSQSERPGYGYQLAHGATSLTEAWDANRQASQNHFMLGQIMEWLYGDLAGLAPDPEEPGFGRVIVRPNPVGDVTWAEASYESVRGPISVRWQKTSTGLRLTVKIPPNATASVQWPSLGSGEIRESGRSMANRNDVREIEPTCGRRTFEIGAGTYEFEEPPSK